ncbi:MAG TPA: PRC-barrel domain-containing protein [Dehalococcoidia bacterium]|nr:PRC-barrel domain-containing protein [Dehalococcoidia bacterium]
MNFEDLKNQTVISIDEGERMGKVTDGVIDLDKKQLVALLLGSGGIIGSKNYTLPVDAIRTVGRDAVTVQSRSMLREGEDVLDGQVRVSDLARRTVISEGGDEIGRISDVELDTSYHVTRFHISTGSRLLSMFGSTAMIDAGQVVAFGEVITVKDGAVPSKEESGKG